MVTKKPDNLRTRVIAIAGCKGGVGKSTVALHLAAAMGTKTRPAVVADLDPQGALTAWALPGGAPDGMNLAADLEHNRPMRTTPAVGIPGVLVGPSDLALADWDGDYQRTRQRLPVVLRPPGAGVVVLDTAPSWGALLGGVLLTADAVVVVAEARHLGLVGLARLLDLVDQAAEQNPRLRLLGILPSRVTRTRLARAVTERLLARYKVTLPALREWAAIAECPAIGGTIWDTPGDSPARANMAEVVGAIRTALNHRGGKA